MADSNFGIKVSKPGSDIRTAADNDLIFSSSWPGLQVVKEITITKGFFDGQYNVSHGLDYPPLTFGWRVSDLSEVSDLFLPNNEIANRYTADVTASDIVAVVGSTFKALHYKCFAVDLSQEKDYPLVRPSNVREVSSSSDIGIKLSKEGKDTDSTDVRDYILHSRCKSPLILKVITEKSAKSNTISFTAPQGYLLWIDGFIRSSSGLYTRVSYYGQAYPRILITKTGGVYTYSLTYAAPDTGATLVVLRDPMFAPEDIKVSY